MGEVGWPLASQSASSVSAAPFLVRTISGGAGVNRLYHDGDQELMEYDGDQEIFELTGGYGAPTVRRRTIRLPGSVDEPILMIDHSLNAACTTTSYAVCQSMICRHSPTGGPIATGPVRP